MEQNQSNSAPSISHQTILKRDTHGFEQQLLALVRDTSLEAGTSETLLSSKAVMVPIFDPNRQNRLRAHGHPHPPKSNPHKDRALHLDAVSAPTQSSPAFTKTGCASGLLLWLIYSVASQAQKELKYP